MDTTTTSTPTDTDLLPGLENTVLTDAGRVVAKAVSLADYERHFEGHYEYVEGTVYTMAPVSTQHDDLTRYFDRLLGIYLELTGSGTLRAAPFTMITGEKKRREPDLMLILHDNPHSMTTTAMHGPADLVIEVVSVESRGRDYGDKLAEYEAVGVREYWIVDPFRERFTVNVLQPAGKYSVQTPEATYTSLVLPKLRVDVPLLWEAKLPQVLDIVAAVQAMVN